MKELRDDPFRTLAGELRRLQGYAKETIPFTEFLWADFLRRRMKRKLVEKNFRRALKSLEPRPRLRLPTTCPAGVDR